MQKFKLTMIFPVEMLSGSCLIIGDGGDKARIYSVILSSLQTDKGWETDLECLEVPFGIHKDLNHEIIYWLITHKDIVKPNSNWIEVMEQDISKSLIENNKNYLAELTYPDETN